MFRIANIRFLHEFLYFKNAHVFLIFQAFSEHHKNALKKLNISCGKMPFHNAFFLTKSTIFETRFVQSNAKKTIARFWNEKIERFTYKQKFTIFRTSLNDINGFLKKKRLKKCLELFLKIKTKYYKNNSKNQKTNE